MLPFLHKMCGHAALFKQKFCYDPLDQCEPRDIPQASTAAGIRSQVSCGNKERALAGRFPSTCATAPLPIVQNLFSVSNAIHGLNDLNIHSPVFFR